MHAFRTIRGSYLEKCDKRAYATEHLAAAQLRLLRARGRTEQSYYRCPKCSMYHLSGREPAKSYALEAQNSIEVNGTIIRFARLVRATDTVVGMALSYTRPDGDKKNSYYNMTREQAQRMLDALIEALYDNSEEETEP